MSEILQGEARPRQRIDSYEIQQRKALEEKKKNAQEFECVEDDGKFSMSSLISMEVKSAKKKKRRWNPLSICAKPIVINTFSIP